MELWIENITDAGNFYLVEAAGCGVSIGEQPTARPPAFFREGSFGWLDVFDFCQSAAPTSHSVSPLPSSLRLN